MLMAGIILFIIGAIFGLINLIAILKNKPTPKLSVLMHGVFVGVALLILIAYIATGHSSKLLISSLILFILAAIGGFTLLSFDLSKKPIPKAIALGHPVVAAAGLITLIVYFFQ